MKNSEISFFSGQEMEEGGAGDEILKKKKAYDESLDKGEEEIPREIIAEGRKRIAAVAELDKLFDQLDAVRSFDTRKTITDKIVIARSDKSGAEEVRYYRRRLDKFRAETERVAA